MRRGLKHLNTMRKREGMLAARAAPYEKGTETKNSRYCSRSQC